MNLSMTFRQIQCSIVTAGAMGKRFSPNGEKIQMMWWTGMHGRPSQLGVEGFPETITITDTDKGNKVYNYKLSEKGENFANYTSEEMPSLPIYLKADKPKVKNEELQAIHSKLDQMTTEFGLNHYGTEIHKKLEEVLQAVKAEYKKNNPEKAA